MEEAQADPVRMFAAPKNAKTWADEVDEADDGGFVLPVEPEAALQHAPEGPPGHPNHIAAYPHSPPHDSRHTPHEAPVSWRAASSLGPSSSSSSQLMQPYIDSRQHQQGPRLPAGPCSIFVSNLPLEAGQQEIAAAFHRALNVQVQHVRHRPTPTEPWVIVDLADTRDLQGVLQAPTGYVTLAGRALVLDVAPDSGDGLRHANAHGGRSPTPHELWRTRSSSSSSAAQPFAPAPAGTPKAVAAQAGPAAKKPDPFGGAKPVDTAAVYLDGHPHHAAAAEARLGAPPAGSMQEPNAATLLAPEPEMQQHMRQLQQQQHHTQPQAPAYAKPYMQPQPGVKLLQRPQTLQQQQQYVMQGQQPPFQQTSVVPAAAYDQPRPFAAGMQSHVHYQPTAVHRAAQPGLPAAGTYLPPNPPGYYATPAPPPPPPPPPPPRAAAPGGLQLFEQQAEPAGVGAAGPHGQCAGRAGAPVGYRALPGSSRASGTGSAGSSRHGSTFGLADEMASSEHLGRSQQLQQPPLHPQQQPDAAGEGIVQWGGDIPPRVSHNAQAQMLQPGHTPSAAAEDDWGKVEALLNQESGEAGSQQLSAGGTQPPQQPPSAGDAGQQQGPVQDSWGPVAVGHHSAEGWGGVPSSSSNAADPDSWGTDSAAAASAGGCGLGNIDSWGAAEAGANLADVARGACPLVCGLDDASACHAQDALELHSRGRQVPGRGPAGVRARCSAARGRGTDAFSIANSPRAIDPSLRARGRGRGRRLPSISGNSAVPDQQQWVPRRASSSSNGVAATEAADASAAASAAVAHIQAPVGRAGSQSMMSRSSSYSRGYGRAGARAGRGGASSRAVFEGHIGAAGVDHQEPGQAITDAADGTDVELGRRPGGRARRGGRSAAPSTALPALADLNPDSWGAAPAEAREGYSQQTVSSGRGRGRGRAGRCPPVDAADSQAAQYPAMGGEGRGRGRSQRRSSAAAPSAAANGNTGNKSHVQQQQQQGNPAASARQDSMTTAAGRQVSDAGGAAGPAGAAAGSKKAAAAPAVSTASKGEKLFKELSAKDKDNKQGAKLENPFELLAQLAAE